MDMTMIPPWMSNLDDEDMTFIRSTAKTPY